MRGAARRAARAAARAAATAWPAPLTAVAAPAGRLAPPPPALLQAGAGRSGWATPGWAALPQSAGGGLCRSNWSRSKQRSEWGALRSRQSAPTRVAAGLQEETPDVESRDSLKEAFLEFAAFGTGSSPVAGPKVRGAAAGLAYRGGTWALLAAAWLACHVKRRGAPGGLATSCERHHSMLHHKAAPRCAAGPAGDGLQAVHQAVPRQWHPGRPPADRHRRRPGLHRQGQAAGGQGEAPGLLRGCGGGFACRWATLLHDNIASSRSQLTRSQGRPPEVPLPPVAGRAQDWLPPVLAGGGADGAREGGAQGCAPRCAPACCLSIAGYLRYMHVLSPGELRVLIALSPNSSPHFPLPFVLQRSCSLRLPAAEGPA